MAPSITPLALLVTPRGHVALDPFPAEADAVDAAVASRIRAALEEGGARAVDALGGEVDAALPPSLAFFRDLARLFFARVCALPDATTEASLELPPPTNELEALARAVPPMTGAEHVTPAALAALWEGLTTLAREELAGGASVQQILQRRNPAWNQVGRVFFHLAENKGDPERPFAFLATYTTTLGASGKAQHRPLGQAVQQAGGRDALLTLLVPVQRAAGRSAPVRELVDSGRVFHPQKWSAADAYRFLRDVPALEEAGVAVRVPDWWRAGGSARVAVQVTIGGRAPGEVGLDALVGFDVSLAVDGEPLTAEEWQRLRREAAGLVPLRGRWVEVDREKLDALLASWNEAKRAARDGVPFHEALRLVAGAPVAGDASGAGTGAVSETWTRIEAGPWLRDTLAHLRSPHGLAEANPGPELRATLRPYQADGVRWLWLLNRLQLGGCLADDMGLGKTVQVLALLVLLKRAHPRRRHLLVVPATLLGNWQAEAARFAPSLTMSVAHPSAKDTPPREAADVVLTTYGALQRDESLLEAEWDTVVLDEAQAIKNAGTKQARAVKQLRSRVRLALTGTPVENRLGDLWSLFDFVNPGLLGTAKAFSGYVKRLESGGGGGYGPLRELVRPYVLRRLKTDRRIITDLPDKTELKAYCHLTRAQAALYERVVAELARALRDAAGIQRRGLVLATLMKLKQICNHPSQWSGDGAFEPSHSGKLARLGELAESIAAAQDKVLVFTQFRELTGPLAAFLRGAFGRAGLELHGETPVAKRRDLVQRFQEDEAVPFLVLSVKAGGTGLNLTAASHVVHFDRWWNPAVEDQATDRAFRIGQKRAVTVHKLVCRGTVEERIDAMLERKKQLTRELLEDSGETLLTELPDDELLRLVSLDTSRALAET